MTKDPRFANLVRKIEDAASMLTAREIANVMASLRALRVQTIDSVFYGEALLKIQDFNALEISNMVHVITSGQRDDALGLALLSMALRKAHDFDPKSIVNMLMNIIKLDIVREEVGHVLAATLLGVTKFKIQTFQTQEIAMLFAAMAQLLLRDHKMDQGLLEEACDIALRKVSEFNPQNITLVLKSLAKFGHNDKALVPALYRVAVHKLHDFNPQSLSTTLLAMGQFHILDKKNAEYYDEAILSLMFAAARARAHEFNDLDVLNTKGALKLLGRTDAPLETALGKAK